MRAVQISELLGPSGVRVVDVPVPEPSHMLTPGEGVLIDVAAAGVSFPDVLQTRGLYQLKPDPPFTPGAEVGGTVTHAPAGSGFQSGDRVMAFTVLGGMAEQAVAPAYLTFALPEQLDFAQGASVILNYHTVYFALKLRGRLQQGERVLVHGAAGGVGTAALQVAKALGASTVAVVSSEEKERVAREAGADDVVRSNGPWREQVLELHRGWRGRGARPGGRGSLHRQSALPARGRARAGGGLHRGVDPRGEGQPSAAAQRVGGGCRVGGICDGQP